MLILLGMQRLSYLPPTVLSWGSQHYESVSLNTVLVAGTVGWNIWLFGTAIRRGWFAPWMAWVDVIWAAGLLLLVSGNIPPLETGHSLNWSNRWGQAATALAGTALVPIVSAGVGVAVVMAAYAVATTAALRGTDAYIPELVGGLNGLFWFAAILGFCYHYLRRQGMALDRLTAERLATESQRARYRTLHDTVLTTLTAIARGGLGQHAAQIRDRCAQEADYVRRLLVDDTERAPENLTGRLAEVATAAGAVGLRVHYQHDPVPDDIPPRVVDALADAAREAVNNVAKHAGVSDAWLTALRTEATTTVRIVDRGQGFDTRSVTPGFGLRESIRGRMRVVGGDSRVSSSPDGGTTVELRWPA